MDDPVAARVRAIVRRTENAELELQAAWPARAQLRAPELDKRYSALPHLFAGAFAPVAPPALERLALACKLLHDAELLRAAEAGEPFGALRASAAQLEACAILAELTGGERRVWDALRELERAHAHALTEEDAYRSGRRGAGELEDGEALALARASEPSARVAVVVLGALAHDERPVEPLLRSLDRYDEARRLAGDLRTWKDDLAARRPTLVLARLARAGGGDPRALAARLYAGGIALDVLALAERACGDAQRALGAVAGVELWTSTVRQLAQRIAAYRGALAPAANAAVAT